MKEAIIYLLFDNWCNSEHEPEVKEAMDKAIQNPTEDTIFQLSSITEANAFKAGSGNYFVKSNFLYSSKTNLYKKSSKTTYECLFLPQITVW